MAFNILYLQGAGVVAAAFLTSLSISAKDYGKQVLEIGLGGGGFDMRLSFFKPEVILHLKLQ